MRMYWLNVKFHDQYWLKTAAYTLLDLLCLQASEVELSCGASLSQFHCSSTQPAYQFSVSFMDALDTCLLNDDK